MGELNLGQVNAQLSRVTIREKKGNLYLRGQFPDGDRTIRKEISLKLKANKEGLRVALAKAKEIDSQLMLEKWEDEKKKRLTVREALKQYEDNYWSRFQRTPDKLASWHQNQYYFFRELPEDEIFDKHFLKKAITYFETGSYTQSRFCTIMNPVAKFHDIDFNFKPYKTYKQPTLNIRELPTDAIIKEVIDNEKYLPHKWIVAILAFFGLRPHEIFRSEYAIEGNVPVVYVGNKTKEHERTAFAIPIKGLNLQSIPNQLQEIEQKWDLTRANIKLGNSVSTFFNHKKYPFSPYQLRHYYAVRGAINGISPVILAKWMGHSLVIHYKHYGSLLSDRESIQLWKDKFTEF